MTVPCCKPKNFVMGPAFRHKKIFIRFPTCRAARRAPLGKQTNQRPVRSSFPGETPKLTPFGPACRIQTPLLSSHARRICPGITSRMPQVNCAAPSSTMPTYITAEGQICLWAKRASGSKPRNGSGSVCTAGKESEDFLRACFLSLPKNLLRNLFLLDWKPWAWLLALMPSAFVVHRFDKSSRGMA
jgi:hypothetical protein